MKVNDPLLNHIQIDDGRLLTAIQLIDESIFRWYLDGKQANAQTDGTSIETGY